ncbi:MAG: nucleotidyl transferase AbiEii/AbiGii toxin family protein [Candidatus Moraniibacteriota bacterium]|nr:MAG: nucleotidyl transferase AbiEii/AbiGii toxin family protein [Candidatus Moranbacteria bacterium]
MLHADILSEQQKTLLPLLQKFRTDFGLVGGTAIALHIGHRASIDFDLFTAEPLRTDALRRDIIAFGKNIRTLVDTPEEYTVLTDGVKLTFLRYPFALEYPVLWDDTARLPELLTLASMKAYALGRRAKWKDYVDICFILETRHSLREIADRAESIFGEEFNEKNFRSQLAYFDDVDYSEAVMYRPGFEKNDEDIKKMLMNFSLSEA